MYGNHPDYLLELGKERVQEFRRVRQAISLAEEAKKGQAGHATATSNQAISFVRLLALKLGKRFRSGHALWGKSAVERDPTSP